MFTNRVTLNLKAGSADQFTHTTESETLPPLQDQQEFPHKIVVTPVPTAISHNSTFVGFERGRRRLQPFVGPKEF